MANKIGGGKKMKRIFFSFVLLIFFFASMPASAADPAYNWTGFYAGLQGSYNVGSSDWDFTSGSETNHTIQGGMGGLYVGYNYHFPFNLVIGIETDISGGKITGSASCPNGSYDCYTEMNWVGSTRGRVGYAFNRFLPYIGVGVAYTNAYLHRDSVATGTEYTSARNPYFGFTPSMGVEFVIVKNLIARAEYAYYTFFTKTVTLEDAEVLDNKIKFHGFKFGLSWKF